MIWNFTISELPDETHYKASVQSKNGEGVLLRVCMCVCVLNNSLLSGWTSIYLSIHMLKDILIASKFGQ